MTSAVEVEGVVPKVPEVLCEAEPLDRTAGGAHDRRAVRRRGSREQGRALELLGHAVEYLVDSGLFAMKRAEAKGDEEAVQILMRASRGVFEECAEVISLKRRITRWAWDCSSRLGFDRRKR